MKRYHIFSGLLSMLVWCCISLNIYAQVGHGNRILISVYEMATDGDSIVVDYDMIFKNYAISSSDQVLFTPVVSDNVTGAAYDLPAVLIEGKKRARLNRRMASLKRKESVRPALYAQTVATGKSFTDTIRYTYTFPYQDWMGNARLDVFVDKCGCGASSGDLAQSLVAMMPQPVSGPFHFQPAIHFVVPQKEGRKERVESGTAYVTFLSAKHDILPDFANNKAELQKIHQSIDYVKAEPSVELDAVIIRAYASPEGTVQSNLALSKRRADALKGYIRSKYDIPSEKIVAEGLGENWDGLLELMNEDARIPNRDEAMRIIRDVDILKGREGQLMRLDGGRPYLYLLENHFPKLRRSDYEIKYTVPGFDVAYAKEVFKTRPEMLSLEEMYLIAQTYEAGSKAFNHVFDMAARLFPADKVANLNAAAAAIYKGDYAYAKEVLERFKDEPEAWNNLGVVYLQTGDTDKAETFLKMAQQSGAEEAAQNLRQLELKRVHDEKAARFKRITPTEHK